ncbi:MAG: PduL/EutD family phosphate acyltransferase, partial [Propionicimonas sp.]
APVTQSGHLEAAGPIEIEGPRGRVLLDHGAMVAARHIHMGPGHARAWGLADQDLVKVAFDGERAGVLENFIIRIKDEWVPEIHLDTDEANALGLRTGDFGKLIRQ